MLEEAGALTAVYRGLSYERRRDQGESLVKNKTLLCFYSCRVMLPHQHFSAFPFYEVKWELQNICTEGILTDKRR